MLSSDKIAIVAMVTGGVILVSLVAIIGGLLHNRRGQLLAHAERMKALELGREMPDDESAPRGARGGPVGEKSYASKCFAATGMACFWGFLFAIGAASKDGGGSPGAAYALAAAAGAVGVTGLICGTVLATREPARPSALADQTAKARFVPDEV